MGRSEGSFVVSKPGAPTVVRPTKTDNRSQLAAVTKLALAGDLSGLLSKASQQFLRRAPRLPANLTPHYRPAGRSPASSGRARPRIWMATPSLSRDGAPLSQFELAKGLLNLGFDVELVAAKDGPLAESYLESQIPLRIVPDLNASAAVPSWYEADVGKLAGILELEKPDLVFASTLDAFPVIDAARAAGIASVWNIREGQPWPVQFADRHPQIAARALACLNYPRALIFVARASSSLWHQFAPPARSHVVYNAPARELLAPDRVRLQELREAMGAGADDFLIVNVGTLCPRKNQVELARAFGALPDRLLKTGRLAFVGRIDGDYDQEVRSVLPQAVIERTVFTGPLDASAARTAIGCADLLVSCSMAEAFPRTFLEAAALRTPIVASALEGTAERLVDEQSALLYALGDIDALARQMARVMSDPKLRDKLARAARDSLVGAWTFDRMLSSYAQHIRAALGAPTSTGTIDQ